MAKYIDTTLKACNLSGFVWIGGPGQELPIGLTEAHPFAILNTSLKLFRDNLELSNHVKEKVDAYSPLIVVTDQNSLPRYMQGHFDPKNGLYTTDMPPCIPQIPIEIGKVQLLLRTQPSH